MASNLACVGLGVADNDEFQRLLHTVLSAATPLGNLLGVEVRRWQDTSGARLLFGPAGDDVVDLMPSLASHAGALLADVRMVNDEVATAAVVALGVGVQVFADGDEYAASDASRLDANDTRDREPLRMAPESFLSYGVFGERADATADARLSGRF